MYILSYVDASGPFVSQDTVCGPYIFNSHDAAVEYLWYTYVADKMELDYLQGAFENLEIEMPEANAIDVLHTLPSTQLEELCTYYFQQQTYNDASAWFSISKPIQPLVEELSKANVFEVDGYAVSHAVSLHDAVLPNETVFEAWYITDEIERVDIAVSLEEAHCAVDIGKNTWQIGRHQIRLGIEA